MPQSKFDEIDRRAVVDALSRQSGLQLERVGRRRKWFRDDEGRSYWILGGYGEWHGIPEEMMNEEISSNSDGLLVIAIRKKSEIEIFIGPLSPLVAARDKLYRARKTTGDYQFTFTKQGVHLFIDQVPSVTLKDLAKFSFDEVQKESVQRIREAEKLIGALSEEERQDLLRKLQDKV